MAITITLGLEAGRLTISGDIEATLVAPVGKPWFVALSEGSLIRISGGDPLEFAMVVEGAGTVSTIACGYGIRVDWAMDWVSIMPASDIAVAQASVESLPLFSRRHTPLVAAA